MEIIELMINVIIPVMVMSRIALFEERRNFTKEPNVSFILYTIFVYFMCA